MKLSAAVARSLREGTLWVLLALALFHGVIDPDQVWAAAHVDEDWNAEKWGVDDEVAARKAAKLVDFNAVAAALKELRQGG